jgi:ketosteroid isomerase-like protein
MSSPANSGGAVETFLQFVRAINSHDVKSVMALMASDPLLVDSLGNRMSGSPSMEAGWRGYFATCPDYWIQTDDAVAEWHVFADNRPVYEILARRKP